MKTGLILLEVLAALGVQEYKMNEHELQVIKTINELSLFMTRNSANLEESKQVQLAIGVLSNQLVMAVGRRIIKESKK